ncbi:unnamed protein product [Rhodiola kirilowii]
MPPELLIRKSEHVDVDNSPVSVINMHRCTSSVVSSSSSASASANRSSFASDFHDRDSSASDGYQHLAGHVSGGESLSGLDTDPDKHFTVHRPSGFNNTKDQMFKGVQSYTTVQKQDDRSEEIEEDISTDSTPVSFSLALKDCQDRRSKANAKGKKRNSSHSISVGIKSSSPRLEALKKVSVPSHPPSTIVSPGTPSHQLPSAGMHKGWNSERMPLPHKGNRVGPALLPLSTVKTLPSKWEDAERWIFSPASGDISHRQPVQQHQFHRKPKAKSGPLGPSGSAYYSMYTPVNPMSDRRSVGDLMAGSPFSAGLMVTNGLSTLYDHGNGSPARLEPWMPRSVSLHGCSVELPGQSSLPSSRDEKVDNMNDKATNLSCPVSRRDIATQMSPIDSTNSSFKRNSSSCNEDQAQSQFVRMRDVEMDEKITIGSLKNIHRSSLSNKSSRRVNDCTKKEMVPQSSAWSSTKTAKRLGTSTRDEARIIAWENLQKAKADAAIQKLEMKLEKKKASSMNKIVKKLKSAQKKAQEMRKSVLSNEAANPSSGRSLSMYKVRHKSSLSGCFTCHAFDLP